MYIYSTQSSKGNSNLDINDVIFLVSPEISPLPSALALVLFFPESVEAEAEAEA
jgi:hypothetical protein